LSKYRVEIDHADNSVFAIGDKAIASNIADSRSADMEAVIAELDKLIVLLDSYRADNPDSEAIRVSAKRAKKARKELASQEPNPALIHRLLANIYEGVAGVDALVDIVSKLQALISHIF